MTGILNPRRILDRCRDSANAKTGAAGTSNNVYPKVGHRPGRPPANGPEFRTNATPRSSQEGRAKAARLRSNRPNSGESPSRDTAHSVPITLAAKTNASANLNTTAKGVSLPY